MKSRKVCIYWKQGRCNRNPCRFVHGDLATADLQEDRAVKRSKSTQVTSAAVSQKSRNNCQKIESAQKPEASLLVTTTTVERSEDKACCQEWMSGSCGRGDSCQFLHSWSRGDGFSLLARLEGHEWDLNTGECIQTLKAHDDDVTSVICWDQYLVSCSLDKKVKFWGRTEEGGDEIILLYTHEEEHAALALGGVNDSDGKPILFCSWNDNSVGLYELPSLKERGRIYAEKEVRAIRAGQEGLFFTGDASGVVSVWKLAEKLVAS
ncbi:unnamed protein product [Linum tenue]|uniref:C3H1-type domain-containing protein n=1 Tax=Linum tenue TaxID=586396 RepID=A0AAV0NL42_9ROSI|nr:unnamed protein product [Linum tenue]